MIPVRVVIFIRLRPAAAVEFLAGVRFVAPRADGAVVCGVVAAHAVVLHRAPDVISVGRLCCAGNCHPEQT